jgi:hypothetical protein
MDHGCKCNCFVCKAGKFLGILDDCSNKKDCCKTPVKKVVKKKAVAKKVVAKKKVVKKKK